MSREPPFSPLKFPKLILILLLLLLILLLLVVVLVVAVVVVATVAAAVAVVVVVVVVGSGGSRLHQLKLYDGTAKKYKLQTVAGCYVHSKKRQRESLRI